MPILDTNLKIYGWVKYINHINLKFIFNRSINLIFFFNILGTNILDLKNSKTY